MKRIILLIGAILLGLAARAQSVTYTCRYWFDQNHAQAVTTTFGENGWEAELDVGNLTDGLHALHLHVLAADTESRLGVEGDSLYLMADTTLMKWSAPQTYLFLKLSEIPSGELTYHYWFDQDHAHVQSGNIGSGHLLLDVADLDEGLHALHVMLQGTELTASQTYLFLKTDQWDEGTPNYVYHCWLDQDFEHQQSDALGTGHLLLDVADLEEGMHTVHVMLEGSSLTSAESYLFMKVAPFATDSVDMSHLAYHCWFDQDFEHRVTDSLGNGNLLLDVSSLDDGLHTVHVLLEGGTLTATQSYMFMKMPVEDPTTELQYICWFDQDYSNVQTGLVGSGLAELEVSDLPNGIHTVNVQLDNGTRTAPQTYLFYKQPLGGYGIARWEYWINDDFDGRSTTIFTASVDTLEILSLLPVGHPALRSSCFHFHPNGDNPYINAKNQITFRIWDSEMRFFDKSAMFVDEHVRQDIVAQVFERNTTETFAAPRNNQIQWFKLDAVVGDSLSFVASKACTMQLFAPSGEEVYNVSGPESIALGGLHAWEDGTYYLAVHDMTGSGETVSVTYNWVYRYAILAYDVHLVGNGGCSTITFNGNGYNSLLDVYLVNAQNDTIRRLDIGHESNSTTTVTFNFYGVNLGVYDAVFEFYDETIRINGALEVQEPVDIVLTSTVNYPATFRRDTECTYTYMITNNGNMTAYNVPLNVYISSPTEGGITRLSIEGLELDKLYDFIKDSYEWTEQERTNLIAYSDYLAEDIYFIRSFDSDENTGDTVCIRSGFFTTSIAPYTTKTITIRLTSSEFIETWLKYPTEWFAFTEQETRDWSSDFCCFLDEDKDSWNSFSVGTGTAAILCQVAAAACGATGVGAAAIPAIEVAGVSMGLVSCISGAISAGEATIEKLFCVDNTVSPYDLGLSVFGAVAGCASAWGELMQTVRGWLQFGGSLASLTAGAKSSSHNTKSPKCSGEDSQGGKSTPVAPCEPNEIRGYVAESGSHYMMQEIQTITYEIESENDTTATAAAHTIIVRDTLDVNKFDVASLAAYRVTIHDKVLELSGEHNFVYTLDLRPNVYVIAQIQLECDDETGIVVWTITSLDPMTMEPTTDPNQGALPINYNGEGIATFTFNVNLKEPFPDGTEISNRVGIIFDLEEPVITDTWTNTVDAVKPTSHIEEVTPVADSLNFVFVSEDNRSGVWYHSLYYRNASTEQEWQVRKAQIFEDSFVLHLEDLLTTEYLVVAVDSAGNREDKDMVAEYIYTASGLHFVSEGNWSTASNWQEGTLPEADDVAFINAPCQLDQDAEVAALAISDDQTLTVQSGKTLTVNGLLFNPSAEGLVIEDGAQLINATSNVAATMEKGIAAYPSNGPDGWYTIASPMDEMPIAESDFLTPNFDLYRFDETNLTHEEWQNYKANHLDFATFEKGRGYLYANSNSFAPAFMGTLSNTAATYHLTYTERLDALSGFNLIGNPFPHVIYKGAGGAIDNAQLASGYYTLTNEGAWHVHTYEDAIMPGQGILVKTMAGLDLTIAKSNATALSESSDAKASSSRVVLKVSGSWGEDRAFVYFGQGIGLDKMENLSRSVPSLWIRDNGHDYAIAHVDSDCESLELFFSNMQSGDFTLSVDVSDTSFSVLQLTDRITGVTIDLLQQPSYVFHSAGQENEARFSLTFKMETMR